MTYTKEQLIQELSLEGFEPTKQEQMLQMFYASLNIKLSMALVDHLSEEQFSALNAEIAKGDTAVYEWIDKNLPDAAKVVEHETEQAVQDIKIKLAPFLNAGKK